MRKPPATQWKTQRNNFAQIENYLGKQGRIWNAFTALTFFSIFMALWEYKTISSGKGGFATPALLENFLNQLGKDEWEIIEFHTHADNALAFHGLARRPTLRDWTLEAAIAAAAKAEADKLRAELMSRQHAGEVQASADNGTPAGEGSPSEPAENNGLRQLRDTDLDHDPEALAEEAAGLANEWDKLGETEDDLPTFFDAIKPHLRKNLRGTGMSVAIDYLAKRWDQIEADLVGALQECGFVLPEGEDDAPVYLEFEGDLYWLNRNNRGQLFLNTREKPRPRFKITPATRLDPADPAVAVLVEEHAAEVAERARRAEEHAAREAEAAARRAERDAAREAAETARREQLAELQAAQQTAQQTIVTAGLPSGETLLKLIRPFLRRNRRGPGSSGSTYYLAKALQQPEPILLAALSDSGLVAPEKPGEKPTFTDVGGFSYWLNKDTRGGFWINMREKRDRPATETAPENSEPKSESTSAPAEDGGTPAATDTTVAAEPPAPDITTAPGTDAPSPATEPGAGAGHSQPETSAEPMALNFDAPSPPDASSSNPEISDSKPAPGDGDNLPVSSAPAAATPATEPPATESPAPKNALPIIEFPSAIVPDFPVWPPVLPVHGAKPSHTLLEATLKLMQHPAPRGEGVALPLTALADSAKVPESLIMGTLINAGLPPPVPTDSPTDPVLTTVGESFMWLERDAGDGSIWIRAKPIDPTSATKTKGTKTKPASASSRRPRTRRSSPKTK